MSKFIEIKPSMIEKNTFQAIGKEWMLVTAGKESKTNTMTASWGGLGVMFNKDAAFIVIRPQRYTREFIDQEETFSLSFLSNSHRKALSYLGSVSGRNEDKIAKSGLTLDYIDQTPYFKEADTVMICKKMIRQPFDANSLVDASFDTTFYPEKDYHILYIAEILKVLQVEN